MENNAKTKKLDVWGNEKRYIEWGGCKYRLKIKKSIKLGTELFLNKLAFLYHIKITF